MYSIPMNELPPALHSLWRALHDGGGDPFLHPAYARAAAAVRPDVEVGVITANGEVVGFLPFQRHRFGVGGPVGSRLCDTSDVLVRPGVSWDPEELTRAFGLRLLRLPHVPASTTELRPFLSEPIEAPFLDLSAGYEAYRKERIDSGSSIMRQIDRKARKIEREVGPLRFEWHTTSDEIFQTLVRWKNLQRKVTRTPNVLELPWVRAFLERLRRESGEDFAGVLSALWTGDTLASVHFGLCTRNVLQYWFPAYNQDLSSYSPGLLILLEMARAASEHGVQRIDLGPGDELYKQRAATDSRKMGGVSVSAGTTMRVVSTIVERVRVWSRGSTLGDGVRAARRAVLRTGYAVAGGSLSGSSTGFWNPTAGGRTPAKKSSHRGSQGPDGRSSRGASTAAEIRAMSPHIGDDPHARLRILSMGRSMRDADAAVVLLHGRGQEAESMLPLVRAFQQPGLAYLAPEAGGRTWCPHSFEAPLEENEPALSSAIDALDRLIDRLAAAGVPPERTMLVGFSQGACLAVEYVTRRPRRYGGVVALIGGLFGPEGSPRDYSGSLDGTPAFLCTSDPDPHVSSRRVGETAEVLRRLGAVVRTRFQRDAGHVMTEEGIEGARELVEALVH